MYNQDINDLKEWLKQLIELSRKNRKVHSLLAELIEIASQPFHKKLSDEHKSQEGLHEEINPITIFTENGEDGLKNALEDLTPNELINIIKKFGFDPSRKSYRWRKKERLIDLITQRIKSSTSRGDVFSK